MPAATAQGSKVTVNVEGRQFYWRYTYPNGAVSINELRLPAGTPVELVISAPDFDVIHSWWVPSLAGKMDAIPGKVNHLSFVAPNDPGVFVGQCAEFCGIQHAMMLIRVRVVPPSEYQTLPRRSAEGDARHRPDDLRGRMRPVPRTERRGPDRPVTRRGTRRWPTRSA